MKVKSAEFVTSNIDYRKCPPPIYAEYAFIGRSNVGKSSLINMITDRKSLAKTSSKPGKTQLLNHFIINNCWYLVDLPGYGWAKVSKESKSKWEGMIRDYLLHRENLCCLFILIDSRHEPQKIDLEFIRWAGENKIPMVLVMTKCDKQSKGRTSNNADAFKKKLKASWSELPQFVISSSVDGMGREEILKVIEEVNAGFSKNN